MCLPLRHLASLNQSIKRIQVTSMISEIVLELRRHLIDLVGRLAQLRNDVNRRVQCIEWTHEVLSLPLVEPVWHRIEESQPSGQLFQLSRCLVHSRFWKLLHDRLEICFGRLSGQVLPRFADGSFLLPDSHSTPNPRTQHDGHCASYESKDRVLQ